MGRLRSWLVWMVAVLPATAPALAAGEAWREDVEYLMREFPAQHADLFAVVDEASYHERAQALFDSVDRLEPWQVVCGMTELVALARDGHTSLGIRATAAGFGFLPLRMHAFADGWFIFEARDPYQGLVGSRVVTIGGVAIEEALARLTRYVGSPTDIWARTYADISVFVHELLRCQGLADEGPVRLGVVGPDGPGDVAIETVPWSQRRQMETGTPPMARLEPPDGVADDAPYWVRYLEDSRTLYVQFNAVVMDTGDPILAFGNRVIELAESTDAARTVIDVRDNGGGNNFLPRVMVDRWAESEAINRDGRLFTLISRRTFSAAINFVSMMEMRTKTLFVGEPIPEAPNHYGDARTIELPRSGISVRISSEWWQGTIREDDRPWIVPHITAAPTYAEYVAGADPVLDAVLAYEPAPRAIVDAKARRRLAKRLIGDYSFRGRDASIDDDRGRLVLRIDPPSSRSYFKVRSELLPLDDGTLATDISGVTLEIRDAPTLVWRGTEIPLERRAR